MLVVVVVRAVLVVKVVLVLLHVVTLAPKGFGEFEGCGDCGGISWTACVRCESRGGTPANFG